MHSTSGTVIALNAAGFEENIISGECRKSRLELAETPHVEMGIWEGTTGSWRSAWDSWEYFTVISGKGTLTDGDGNVHLLEAGACVWIPAGTTGLWQVDEPVRKSYVGPAKK